MGYDKLNKLWRDKIGKKREGVGVIVFTKNQIYHDDNISNKMHMKWEWNTITIVVMHARWKETDGWEERREKSQKEDGNSWEGEEVKARREKISIK